MLPTALTADADEVAVPGDDGHVDRAPPSPVAAESAVLVPVPEAERVVSGHRARFDRAATWGVPAHVTVLYPFVAPSAITPATIAALAGAVAAISAFDCEFAAAAWFGEEALWLAPRPDEPFRALTHAVSAAFPGHVPYGGVHDAVRRRRRSHPSRLANVLSESASRKQAIQPRW